MPWRSPVPPSASRCWSRRAPQRRRGAEADGQLRLAWRGIGGRDLALGLGALGALSAGGPAATWVRAGALADASDALATLTGFGDLPKVRRMLALATESTAAAAGALVAAALD
ncbi:MAG: hypothetical protein ABR529_11040 [Actinomycetota bacterium]